MYSPINIKRSSKFGNNYWEAYSPKLKRNVRLFSDLEYDFWVLVETDPKILTFCERPFEVKYFNKNNKVLKTFFNMWVKWRNGHEEFIVVKYSTNVTSTNIKILEQWCQKHKKNFAIRSEINIRGNTVLLENMKLLLPYLSNRSHPIDTDLYVIKQEIQRNKHSVGYLEDRLSIGSSRIKEAIFHLYNKGIIDANLQCIPFGRNLEVWINE
ncbi:MULTISPECIES: hypothetical protein [Bacillus]|uniref:hypothetical protein n=1 Tax=Bacillus TaxID=1386 RepID=UPI0020CD4CC5|nr:hypothetical protein [Bacillus safensis]MCP9284619.1 hypothetical protein [Bacillus safensis]